MKRQVFMQHSLCNIVLLYLAIFLFIFSFWQVFRIPGIPSMIGCKRNMQERENVTDNFKTENLNICIERSKSAGETYSQFNVHVTIFKLKGKNHSVKRPNTGVNQSSFIFRSNFYGDHLSSGPTLLYN